MLHAQPTIEQRIAAAMVLNGMLTPRGNLDYEALAERIAAPKYGAATLRRMLDPANNRTAGEADLVVIAKACNVSPAFWDADFARLGLPNDVGLAEKVEALERQMATVLSILGRRLGLGVASAADEQRARREGPSSTEEPGPSD